MNNARPPWLSRDWFWGLLLMAAVVVTYLPVWHAGFNWDDDIIVTANPCIVGPLGLKEIWFTSAGEFIPLVLTTFWIEHALWGLSPLGYHLVNVLMHGACAIALWRVLRSLRMPGAWFGAALWALHPVEVESVAWISELKNTQSCLFFLLAILFFVKWLRAKDAGRRDGNNWNYGMALLFAALSMASKSSTIGLPLILCLCGWWVEGRWDWRSAAKLWPVFLMSLFASVLTVWTVKLHLGLAYVQSLPRSWPQRIATVGDTVWFYLGKLLWPHPLILIYPRWDIEARRWESYVPLLLVLIVLSILWIKRASSLRPCFFVFAYFLAALLPVLGLIDTPFFPYSFVFDHYQYLASMGPLALAGAGLAWLADFIIAEKRGLKLALGAALLFVLGALSWQRSWVFESPQTLWADTLAQNSRCWLAYNNFGSVLFQQGQVDESMDYFLKSLEINPTYTLALVNVGNALMQQGRTDEAIAWYEKALRINPDDVRGQNNLGNALSKEGKTDLAIAHYEKAIEISPNDPYAYNNIGNELVKEGRTDEAINEFQKAMGADPRFAEVHYNAGNLLFEKGEVGAAMTEFQKAVQINPAYAEAHNNLGAVYFQRGEMNEAVAEYQKALAINPGYKEAHYNLGLVFAQTGQMVEAIAQFQETLRLDPQDRDAQNSLTRAEAMAR